MLALFAFADLVVVEPTPAMADNLVTLFEERSCKVGILLKPADNGEDADLDVVTAKDAQQAPTSYARPIFKRRLDHWAALARVSRKANIGQHILRAGIALEDRTLATRFNI